MAHLIKQVCRVKIITCSQLDSVIILLLTELRVVRPCEKTGLQPQFEVCNPRIKNLGGKRTTFVFDVVYACNGWCGIENVKRFFLCNAQVGSPYKTMQVSNPSRTKKRQCCIYWRILHGYTPLNWGSEKRYRKKNKPPFLRKYTGSHIISILKFISGSGGCALTFRSDRVR